MPITRRQFDLGIDEAVERWMINIHGFLSRNKEQAFSAEDLWKNVTHVLPTLTAHQQSIPNPARESLLVQFQRRDFELGLQKLAEIRAIDVRYVKEQPYYAFLNDLADVW